MFAEILLGEGGQFGFHGEKMRAFDKGLQNNQINLLKGRTEKALYHARGGWWGPSPGTPWQRPSVPLSPAWVLPQGTSFLELGPAPEEESLFHLQMLDLRSVKTPCQQEHNATSPRQKKANIHGAQQVKRNVGFAEWG